jgi:UPF0755 protein
MSLFRRSDDSHERSPEEREYARQLREARRKGLPDPPRPASQARPEPVADEPPAWEPEAPGADGDPIAGELPADEHAWDPEATAVHDAASAADEVAWESQAHDAAAAEPAHDSVALDDPAWAPEPEPEPEPEAAEQPPPADAEPEPADPEPLASLEDDDLDLTWTEPERTPRGGAALAAERETAEPPATEAHDIGEGIEFWDEPPAPVQPTASHSAPPGDDLPPRNLAGVPRQPPPLPAPRSSRELPKPPRRRYAGAAPRRSPAGPPTHRRGRWIGRVVALVALVAMVAVLWFLFSLFQPGKGDGDGRVAVVIPQGATARQIGDLLAEKGVVSSGFFFDLRARIGGERDSLKAGRFVLAEDMSYGSALERLSAAPEAPPTVTVTIPEGRSRRETAPLVKDAGLKGSYMKASASQPGFSPAQYGAPGTTDSLEGFLFPATYELRENRASARELVGQQLAAFEQNFGEVDLRKARRKNLTPYDVLIIASMVEREAQVDKERPLIAAVIYNRLRDGMALGIDATTRYELGQWSRPLRVSELEADTPYNTRINPGLPPTPIGNPGLASMQAAANPARVDYLFYVVKPGTCGEHAFSADDAQFQQDVAAYEAARAANGGNSPDTC